jgi:two-component system, cell cycle sensor histidine kinase and response regulator CckA
MDNVVRILIVEDLPSDADLAKREIKAMLPSCVFEVVETQKDYLAAIEKFQPDLIVSDYKMPHFDGLTALKLAQQEAPMVPFIILTGSMNEETAVECMKAGAADYVIKEHIKRLGLAVVSVLEQKRLRLEKERAEAVEHAALNALQESEERYRSFFDNSIDAVLLTSPDGRILKANAESCRIFGYTEEELFLVGRNGVVDPSDPQLPKALEERNRTGRFKGELTLVRKDGKKFPGEISTAVFKDKENVVRTSMIIRDITERRRAEQETTSLQDQLRQSQKVEAIGQLAGGIAHDFNNLLTIIQGNSQLSLMDLQEGDPLKANIEEIQEAAKRAADLTRQLLAFSRKQILEMRVLDLNQVLQRLDKMLRRVIGEDIDLTMLLPELIWKVMGDPGQIEQVIMNLSVNARDAMPEGGKLTIETANVELDEEYAKQHIAVQPGRYVMLSMSDTGVGMAPEVRERIFEPFFTTKEKGTGLGLSTVYGIVKQTGGNIWVYSEPGQGTTFKIYLPQVDAPVEELREEVVKEISRGHETILLVEDEDIVRKLAARVLKKQGYKVLEAPDGGKAFMLCETVKEPIHLILTDVVMPGMSGRKLVDRLKEIHPETKVLYMSGYTDNAILHHSILGPGTNFIQKPFTIDGLARKVREALDK